MCMERQLQVLVSVSTDDQKFHTTVWKIGLKRVWIS